MLPPYSCLPYAWDEPSLPNKVVLLLPGHRSLGTFALDEVGGARSVLLPAPAGGGARRGKRRLAISTHADGPTRVLRVVDVTSHPPAAGPGGAAAGAGATAGGVRGRSSAGGHQLLPQLRAALRQRDGGDGSPALPGSPRAPARRQHADGGNAATPAAAPPPPAPPPPAALQGGAGAGAVDVRVQLRGAALSLVSDAEELLFASARGVAARLAVDAVRVEAALSVDALRAENTLFGAQYPLLLASPVRATVFGVSLEGAAAEGGDDADSSANAAAAAAAGAARGRSGGNGGSGGEGGDGSAAARAPPALGVLCTLWRDRPGGVMCFERLGVHAAPLALSLEGLHLKALLDFAASMSAAAAAHGVAPPPPAAAAAAPAQDSASLLAPPYAPPPQPPPRARQLNLYFDSWYISPLRLCITFAPGSFFEASAGQSTAQSAAAGGASAANGAAAAGGGGGGAAASAGVRPASGSSSTAAAPGAGGAATSAAGSAGAAAAGAVTPPQLPVWAQVAVALAHAEGAWLTLDAFHARHPLLDVDAAVQVLGRHYVMAAYQELPKIVASLDILGDPARVLHSLGLGFWHLLTLPAISARRGPVRGLQRLASNARGVAFAVSNGVEKGSRRVSIASTSSAAR